MIANLENTSIAFFDLTESSQDTMTLLQGFHIPIENPFRRIHVITEKDLNVLENTKAFCELWTRVPYWNKVVPFVRSVPGIIKLSDYIYAGLVDTRLKLNPSHPGYEIKAS